MDIKEFINFMRILPGGEKFKLTMVQEHILKRIMSGDKIVIRPLLRGRSIHNVYMDELWKRVRRVERENGRIEGE